MTHCPKLHAAYAAMLVELLGRGAVPIVFCTERAREFGISERTLFKARSHVSWCDGVWGPGNLTRRGTAGVAFFGAMHT